LAGLPQKIEVNEAVGIGVENVSASVAALSHMGGNIDRDHTSQTSHAGDKVSEKLGNVPSVPGF
jgi:hypothetical protein